MSNKADNQSAFLDRSKTITGSVLEAALTLEPGLYIVDTKATDTPVSGIWYYAKIYDVFSDHRILELYSGAAEGHKEIYYNTYNPNDSDWKGWYHFATATPPQEYGLPLAEGLIQSSASWYNMDQFNQVHVHGAISAGSSGSLGWDTLVATLPEGYRPSVKIEAAATFDSDGTSGCGAVAVSEDGTIKAFPDISATKKVVYFDVVFLATSK